MAFSHHEAFSTRILSCILHPRLVTHDTKHAFVVLTSRSSHYLRPTRNITGVVVPRAVAARKPVGGRGALVVVAGGRSIGCTLQGTRRARARTSGFRARLATPGGRRTLKLRRKKGRKYLAPAGAPNMWNKAKRKNLK